MTLLMGHDCKTSQGSYRGAKNFSSKIIQTVFVGVPPLHEVQRHQRVIKLSVAAD